MGYTYPPMPAYDPSTPKYDDHCADALIERETVTLTLINGVKIVIPGKVIEKGSIKITRGSDSSLNLLQLTIFGGTFECTDDAEWTEIVPPLPGHQLVADA